MISRTKHCFKQTANIYNKCLLLWYWQ